VYRGEVWRVPSRRSGFFKRASLAERTFGVTNGLFWNLDCQVRAVAEEFAGRQDCCMHLVFSDDGLF